MEDKYLQHEGCTPEPPQDTIRDLTEDQSITMHCGYLFYLFVALWVELAVGMTIPLTFHKIDTDRQSIIEDLKHELDKYETVLNKQVAITEASQLCSTTAAQSDPVQLVVNRLIEYQKCANGTQFFIEDKDKIFFKRVTQMNKELLEHLGTLITPSNTTAPPTNPPPTTSSSRLPFNIAKESMTCFRCWKQQVAALSR